MIEWIGAVLVAIGVWLIAHGIHPSHLVGGFFGGITRAVISKTGNIWERLASGFTGSLFAVYFTPLLCLALGLPDPATASAIAFGLGLIGMNLAEALMNWAKRYAKDSGKFGRDLRAVILRILG